MNTSKSIIFIIIMTLSGLVSAETAPRMFSVVPAETEVFKFSDMTPIRISEYFPDLYQGNDIVGRLMEGDSITLTLVSFLKGVKSPHHNHPAEEFISVVKGKLKVVSGGKTHILNPGDSVRFPSYVPHQVEALEDTDIIEAFGPPGNPGSSRNAGLGQ